jgi:HD superfamily phosphodiesterase
MPVPTIRYNLDFLKKDLKFIVRKDIIFVESFLNFLIENSSHIDNSHNLNHILRVLKFSTLIIKNDYPQNSKLIKNGFHIIFAAIILHDLCDIKYYKNDFKKLEKLIEKRNIFIKSKLNPKKANIVINIIGDISYTRAKNNLLNYLWFPWETYYSIVSDADKLDALGIPGVARVEEYSHTSNRGSNSALEYMESDLINYLPYMRTEFGKFLAAIYINDMKCHIQWRKKISYVNAQILYAK